MRELLPKWEDINSCGSASKVERRARGTKVHPSEFQSGSHTSRFSHSAASDANQINRSSSMTAPVSRLCGTRKTPALYSPALRKARKWVGIVPTSCETSTRCRLRGERQDLGIGQATQTGDVRGEKIHGRFTAENTAYDGLVEISIGEKPDFHEGRGVCNSSRARISRSRRSVGSGSLWRFPSAHFRSWPSR